jgi:hypothetical protein
MPGALEPPFARDLPENTMSSHRAQRVGSSGPGGLAVTWFEYLRWCSVDSASGGSAMRCPGWHQQGGALLSSCKGPWCLIGTMVPGLHVHPGWFRGGVESSSGEGAGAPSLVRLIAALGRPRTPRMREVARPGWVGAGCST